VKSMAHREHSKAVQFLHDLVTEGKPEYEAMVQEEEAKFNVAWQICKLRTKHRLTQRQLAALVNTSASCINRLEDADYEGHSLGMLHRIAEALDSRVVIRFEPHAAANGNTTTSRGSNLILMKQQLYQGKVESHASSYALDSVDLEKAA
jgi:transcriptional regulator with XRE-family HTH domain